MRTVTGCLLVGFLIGSVAARAGGYYLDEPGSRNVIWPPPGGLDSVQPPMGGWAVPGGYSGYGPPPAAHWYDRSLMVPPPRPDWPDLVPPPAPERLKPGQPVEVVPPPGIPVEQVPDPRAITPRPHHQWRPVNPEDAVQRAAQKQPAHAGELPPRRLRPQHAGTPPAAAAQEKAASALPASEQAAPSSGAHPVDTGP